MNSTKRPRKERSREDFLLEIQEMKSMMMRYCSTTSTLEEVDADADDTTEIQKNLMDFKKNTEDMKSMTEDLVCKQRRAYDEFSQALERMTKLAMIAGNKSSVSDEEFHYAVQLAEKQKEEIDELKREKKDLEIELEEFKKPIDKLKQMLQKKEDQLKVMDTYTVRLIDQERSLYIELQEAREELIRGLGDECNRSALIGVTTMGALDSTAFNRVIPKKEDGKGCSSSKGNNTAEIFALEELYSFWKNTLRDQSWHPFKTIEEVIDENDELLKGAKDELGEEVYKAITTAALELNEYNPKVREPVQEIWNFKERRKATTKEAISLVLKQLKSCKQLKASRRSAR